MESMDFDVVVVGAGFGGATCAPLLAKRGLRVALVEKNSQAGGKAMVISKNGFTYEMWPVIHAPSKTSICLDVLRELGLEQEVELSIPEVQGAIFVGGGGDIRRFPARAEPDPNEILDVLEVAEAERPRAIEILTEIALLKDPALGELDETSFEAWLEQRNPPDGLRSYLHAICNGVFMVTSDTLAASEAIRTVQEILLGTGGLYCRNGGIGRLAEVFASAVERNGGRVVYGARVRQIPVEDGRVTGVVTDKGTFRAPVVVSNAGLQPTVLKLVGEQHFDRSYVNWVKDLIPSWGMMGVRYFLSRRLLDQAYHMVFSKGAYWTTERWLRTDAGEVPRDVIMWVQVPSNHEAELAPPDRQCVLTGIWCSPDPDTPAQEKERWWSKVDEMMERLWPGFMACVDARETYDVRDVANLSRESAFPGVGGECIGLGQVIGQAGAFKPSAQAPVRGLFYVGCDAGGYGCGTHQAVHSGVRVADQVFHYRQLRRAVLRG
jgi:prolycopene isomerase